MPAFTDFGLGPLIISSLEKMGFKEPTPIQTEAIPLIQKKHDLIALAQTGSGKTATCAIPICDRVDVSSPNVQALIIVPTRELALQYATEAQKIGQEKGVKAFAVYGGEDAAMQQSKLKNGVQVLVATPGRLIDFIYSRSIDLSNVETLILDEADEMLSMGFYEDLEFIIQCLNHVHQTLLFSATMPKEIRAIAQKHMIDPQEVSLISTASPASIEHKFVYCKHFQRAANLIHLVESENPKQAIVFCQSREQCEEVCKGLQQKVANVDFLHAGLGQNFRSAITSKFRSGRIRILVATDVAARGLDFSEVSHIFIYQLANDPDVYVHRAGRTGRRDRAGIVITLVTDRELPPLHRVLARLNRDVVWIGAPPPTKPVHHRHHVHRPPPSKHSN